MVYLLYINHGLMWDGNRVGLVSAGGFLNQNVLEECFLSEKCFLREGRLMTDFLKAMKE